MKPAHLFLCLCFALLLNQHISTAQSITIHFAAKNLRNGNALPLDSICITDLILSKDTTLIGRTSLTISSTTSISDLTYSPTEFFLTQTFSNPFLSETSVDILVTKPASFTLSVINALGQRLISNREWLECGVHRVSINIDDVPPGMYLLSVTDDISQSTRKLLKVGAQGHRPASIGYQGVSSLSRTAMTKEKPASVMMDRYRFIGYVKGCTPDTLLATPVSDTTYTFEILATELPVVTTKRIDNVTTTSATSGGDIISYNTLPITARGICWSAMHIPTIADTKIETGNGVGNFSTSISGLSPRTVYYMRAYAVNSAGVGYGEALLFVTQQDGSGTVTDIDGNTYRSVSIGRQIWMVENLNVSRYRTGDSIPIITDPVRWNKLKTHGCCFYDNNKANGATYGRLYNFFAAVDTRQLAPAGWHVPGDDEWQTLIEFLGGDLVAGGRMKEAGIAHWCSPNVGATNESGFTALPSGRRDDGGVFIDIGVATKFWSTLSNHSNTSWERGLSCRYEGVYFGNDDQRAGLAVRCVKD